MELDIVRLKQRFLDGYDCGLVTKVCVMRFILLTDRI